MRIIKNQQILQRQSENYIRGELSNVAAVVQAPQIFTTYYPIDPDLSPTTAGLRGVEDFIHSDSPIVYHKIENLPMSGIDNLVTQSKFDEELGFDEDLQSSGIIFPNTIVPKPNDCFTINGSEVTALYVVTDVSPVTVRSNPFTEIQFRLFSRDSEVIKQLERQVQTLYMTTVTAIGLDKSLVIKKDSYFTIQDHIKSYLDILSMYKVLFWDRAHAAFIFDGLVDPEDEQRYKFLDVTLWKYMFDEHVILFDEVMTYATNNYQKTYDRVYSSNPSPYLEEYLYRRSILMRLYEKDHKNAFDTYRFPQAYIQEPQVGKFMGKNIVYLEYFSDTSDCNLMCRTCCIWDEEFLLRIKNNDPYPNYPMRPFDTTDGCVSGDCSSSGIPYVDFNVSLRNAIITWYNGGEIDWDKIELHEQKTCENYYLIPLLLGMYKQYIRGLQK